MATSTPVKHAWRALLSLGIITGALFGINAIGVAVGASSWAPALALDLQGGTQIVLEAQTTDGEQISQEQLNQAATIIRQRVDASGVGETDITTEGGRNIVVQIPGAADEDTRNRIEASAQLLKPGGLMICSTLNRNPKSFAMAIVGAEWVMRWLPKGTHDWAKFITPDELYALIRKAGLEPVDRKGMVFNPISWKWSISARDLSCNYVTASVKR